ncbi:sugar nucleotide-binding protein [Sphingomonas sp. CFBP 8760]|nr:family 1 glycosylhydrolase [Sphingomonas sp. CFBP 8760]MBD8548202.1 sugar nucleotide-binding protein [Sphingomonas sp. CFBP 8760]
MESLTAVSAIELWGGIECTVNRVGDRYTDQVRLSGHHDRLDDLDRFADLGVKALRYPVLWERTMAGAAGNPDWHWPDARLARLRALGIRPIVGLVHHGSGPYHTHLLDDGFAAGVGRYAAMAAARYPWVTEWTPINEPLTTARFSALYGHWYPHAADDRSFWTALLNQVDATRAAMTAIRTVIPDARLIQTDDLGRTYATRPLMPQARHDNQRRWAGWDLLFGHVDRHHPLFAELDRMGLGARLRRIVDDPGPPDIIGVNHYLTSDRFLDHRLDRYPDHLHGGNDRQAYADTEAIRVLDPPPAGLGGALREAWQRYRTPIALTEVHNGCTREEQLRWAAEAWETAAAVAAEGVDIRAVIAWSLLGSWGWNTLLTGDGVYEPGVYDVASGLPRPTALASLWRGLPDGAPRHPVAEAPGWWRRSGRLIYGSAAAPSPNGRTASTTRPLLICGGTGTLGRAFADACVARGIAHLSAGRETIDLDRIGDLAATLDAIRPWGVVNAMGWVRVDEAEANEAACHRVNADGAGALAEACADRGIACLNISSDLVFAGDGDRPLVESDVPRPLNAYGRSKVAMEARCAGLDGSLVIRTAAFFSPHDPHNFAVAALAALAGGRPFAAAHDHVVSPTFVPWLVNTALDLLIDDADGLWHLSAGEAVSWADFARRIAMACGYDPDLIRPVDGATLGWRAPRPRHVPLGSIRRPLAPSLDAHIEQFARQHRMMSRAFSSDGVR